MVGYKIGKGHTPGKKVTQTKIGIWFDNNSNKLKRVTPLIDLVLKGSS